MASRVRMIGTSAWMADAESAAGLSRETLEAVIERSSYTRDLGVRLAAHAPGEVEIRLPVQPRFAQHYCFVHGSLVGSMSDTACACACACVAASVAGEVVTTAYKLNLLAPAVADALVARGTVVKAGARQMVARADVFAVKGGAERMVAVALATIARV